ncbi:hypothetical protein RFX70_21920, partial [Acinetobacter baumannii]|nr:hypothetical protein [Acinetobacter baumannii]
DHTGHQEKKDAFLVAQGVHKQPPFQTGRQLSVFFNVSIPYPQFLYKTPPNFRQKDEFHLATGNRVTAPFPPMGPLMGYAVREVCGPVTG